MLESQRAWSAALEPDLLVERIAIATDELRDEGRQPRASGPLNTARRSSPDEAGILHGR